MSNISISLTNTLILYNLYHKSVNSYLITVRIYTYTYTYNHLPSTHTYPLKCLPLKCISININGLNNGCKRGNLYKYRNLFNSNVAFLQETHLLKENIHRLNNRKYSVLSSSHHQQKKGCSYFMEQFPPFY